MVSLVIGNDYCVASAKMWEQDGGAGGKRIKKATPP